MVGTLQRSIPAGQHRAPSSGRLAVLRSRRSNFWTLRAKCPGRLKRTPVATPPHLVTRLEIQLAQNFPELTPRERAACARTQAGWSAKKMARDLGIRAATVFTYRKRAYQRFGFSSAHDCLDRMLD